MQGLWGWYPRVLVSVTWHLTRDMRHRDIAGVVSTTAPVLSRHDVTLPPLCSPPPLIQFPSHLAWRGGSVSQNIEVSPVFYSVTTNQCRWHVTHVTPPWPSDESWHTGEPLMRCHNDTGAREIYRGLESAKLSRCWGLPSWTTQRHRHNQTHKNTSINFHSCNRVNFDSWPGRADGLNNIH